jgi:CDP-glucose 4,6-dehydratase
MGGKAPFYWYLKSKGHEVSGYSLDPLDGALFTIAALEQDLKHHTIGDIRDISKLRAAISRANPDVVIHLAAQPLVLRSYEDPIETYTTNVNGTLNLLEVITELPVPPITLVITTDKVYKDTGKGSYSESDPLGGHDPYSASKAMVDILTQSWAATNPTLPLHVARAGNVIGAFDVSPNRLIPDILRSLRTGSPLEIRHPLAVRPWQHVQDCLAGYLSLVEGIMRGERVPVALNFGPHPEDSYTVKDVVEVGRQCFPNLKVGVPSSPKSTETGNLSLNSNKALSILGWSNKIPFMESVVSSFIEPAHGARSFLYSSVEKFQNATYNAKTE